LTFVVLPTEIGLPRLNESMMRQDDVLNLLQAMKHFEFVERPTFQAPLYQ
jgi:hypothetical protein